MKDRMGSAVVLHMRRVTRLRSPDCNWECCARLLRVWPPARAYGDRGRSSWLPLFVEDSNWTMHTFMSASKTPQKFLTTPEEVSRFRARKISLWIWSFLDSKNQLIHSLIVNTIWKVMRFGQNFAYVAKMAAAQEITLVLNTGSGEL